MFPVVETEIGRLGAAICYDWLFPEAIRALALAGAEVLIRVSAYMDPWGATPPMDWWTLFNRARAVENFAFVVAANQGAGASNYPPFSWPGGSMVVDFDGRILAQADPGPRREDRGRPDRPGRPPGRAGPAGRAIEFLAHLRTEAIPGSVRPAHLRPAAGPERSAPHCRPPAAELPTHPAEGPRRRGRSSRLARSTSSRLACSCLRCGGRPGQPDSAPHCRRDPRTRSRPTSSTAVMAAHYRGLGAMERYEYADGGRGLPRGPRAGPRLDPRLDQPGHRPAEPGGRGRRQARRPAGQGGGAPRSTSTRPGRSSTTSSPASPTTPGPTSPGGSSSSTRASSPRPTPTSGRSPRSTRATPTPGSNCGSTLTDPDGPGIRPGSPAAPRADRAATPRPWSCNPYLATAIYKLAMATGPRRRSGRADVARSTSDPTLNPKKNPAGSGRGRRHWSTARWAGTPR